MRLNKIMAFGTVLTALSVLVAACSKDGQDTATAPVNIDLSNNAIVQYYNAAVNIDRNYLYVDGKPVTGAIMVYTNATTTVLFPLTGTGFAVTPGLRGMLIRDTLGTSTQPALSFPQSFDANKKYTIFSYDTSNAIKQKTVETVVTVPSDTTSRVRLAHFAYLSSGLTPAIDVFSKRLNANIFSNIGYTQVTDFMPYAAANSRNTGLLTDTLLVRQAGNTTTNLDTMVFNPLQKISYTLVFRGRYATNGAGGGTIPRTLTSFANY